MCLANYISYSTRLIVTIGLCAVMNGDYIIFRGRLAIGVVGLSVANTVFVVIKMYCSCVFVVMGCTICRLFRLGDLLRL